MFPALSTLIADYRRTFAAFAPLAAGTISGASEPSLIGGISDDEARLRSQLLRLPCDPHGFCIKLAALLRPAGDFEPLDDAEQEILLASLAQDLAA